MQVNYMERKAFEIEVNGELIGMLYFDEEGKIHEFKLYQDYLISKDDFDKLKAVLDIIQEKGYKWTRQ